MNAEVTTASETAIEVLVDVREVDLLTDTGQEIEVAILTIAAGTEAMAGAVTGVGSEGEARNPTLPQSSQCWVCFLVAAGTSLRYGS